MKIASIVWKLMAMSEFLKSLKGGNFIKVHYRVISFGQNVALVIVNKFVKFDETYEKSINSVDDMVTSVLFKFYKER